MTGTGLVKFAVILSERSESKDLNENTDCHTSDVGHWFAMTGTGLVKFAVILSERSESKDLNENTDCHTQ